MKIIGRINCERATFTAAAAANNRWLIVGSIDGDGDGDDDDDGIGKREREVCKQTTERTEKSWAQFGLQRAAAAEVSEKKITQIDAADSITHTLIMCGSLRSNSVLPQLCGPTLLIE